MQGANWPFEPGPMIKTIRCYFDPLKLRAFCLIGVFQIPIATTKLVL